MVTLQASNEESQLKISNLEEEIENERKSSRNGSSAYRTQLSELEEELESTKARFHPFLTQYKIPKRKRTPK